MIWKSKFPDVIIPTNISFMEFFLKNLNEVDIKRPALVSAITGKTYTFADVLTHIKLIGSVLTKQGIKRGDIVGICALNSPEYILTMLGIFACGATVTSCNPYSTSDEISLLFENSQPVVVFISKSTEKAMRIVSSKIKSIKKVYSFDSIVGFTSFDDLLKNEDGRSFPAFVNVNPEEDILFLPYSSGTTGLPKGVMLTHNNMIAILTLYKVFNRATYKDCNYSVLPLFHIYGMTMAMLSLMCGLRHILDERFHVERALEFIQREKVTVLHFVPPMVIAVTKYPHLEKYDLSSLKLVHSGAAPLGSGLPQKLKDRTGIQVYQGWGLTEMLPIVAPDPQRVPDNSVGFVAPNTQIKILDVNTKEELGCNQDGEIVAKGPQLMKGYYKRPAATLSCVDTGGWFHTGDIGHFDENGMLYIVDRLKEIIKYKGFQIAPAELENVLLSHSEVLDAAVIGIPHQDAGEVPKAFVVLKHDGVSLEEIDRYVQGHVSKYKYLRGGIEVVKQIPKSASGKILRRYLKELHKKAVSKL